MTKVVFNMAMSIDGFVNDRDGKVDKLYPNLDSHAQTDLLQKSIQETGAVVMGRRTFEMAGDPDWYAGNYEYQVPIFVVTKEAPKKQPKQTNQLIFTFVDSVEDAIKQAKAAASEKQVTVVGGPNVGQQLIRAGLVDELQIGVMPVLLGQGTRLFDHLEDLEFKLEKLKIVETGPRTDIWFRVR